MDSLLSIFLLFIAAMTALLTYMFIPHVPVVALTSASAIALAAGVWWHWTQFSIDYRTSTWQEQLRNYASYAMVLLVILLSYGFYVFAYSGSTLEQYAASAQTAIREAGRKATSQIIGGTTRALSATSTALFSEATEEPIASNLNFRTNRNRSANFLA
jgi:hypothetical protein